MFVYVLCILLQNCLCYSSLSHNCSCSLSNNQLPRKFKKSIFLFLLHFLSNQTCKTHIAIFKLRPKPNNHQNTKKSLLDPTNQTPNIKTANTHHDPLQQQTNPPHNPPLDLTNHHFTTTDHHHQSLFHKENQREIEVRALGV